MSESNGNPPPPPDKSKVTIEDFKLTEEEQVEYNAMKGQQGFGCAGYMRKKKTAFRRLHGIVEERFLKDKDGNTPELSRNASEIRAGIKKYMKKKKYSPIESLIDMTTEKDKKGNYVLSAKERVAIHKDLAKYEAPQYRSSDTDKESKSNVQVEIKNFTFEDDGAEVLPPLKAEEYEEFEFLEENDK